MKLILLVSSAFAQSFGNGFIDTLDFTDVTLSLNNANYIGKEVEYEERQIEVFRGIKFGAASRFFPPIVHINNGETIEANTMPKTCMQAISLFTPDDSNMSEDCLTLDIYRPSGVTNAEVVVFIYGGGYQFGDSSTYNGMQFAKDGFVAVFIQYRIDIYGFMSSFDTENNRVVGGNYGLMDQKLALEFIFEHSVAIGGNGDRLTINGESAGAWSCSSQLIHPDSDQYIKTVISQSGGALNGFLTSASQKSVASNYFWHNICGQIADCTQKTDFDGSLVDTIDYINDLRRLSPAELRTARDGLGQLSDIQYYSVLVDGVFFTEDPTEKIREGNVRSDVTYVITTNSFEGSIAYAFMSVFGFTEDTFSFPAYQSILEMVGEESFDVSNQTVQIWLDSINAASGTNILLDELSSQQAWDLAAILIGDVTLRVDMVDEAKYYADAGAAVYVGYFDMSGSFDFFANDFSCCGVAHAAELGYTVAMSPGFKELFRDWEVDLVNVLSKEYSSIIKTGAPTSIWQKYDSVSNQQFRMSNTDTKILTEMIDFVVPSPSKDAVDRWLRISSSALSFSMLSVFLSFVLLL